MKAISISNSRVRIKALACLAVLCLVVSFCLIYAAGRCRVEVFGISMEPTLHHGDILLVDHEAEPHVGDIVICDLAEKNIRIVKRITAGPGDAIQFKGSEYTLGVGEFFVMGDNREYSSDSRDFGPLQRQAIWGVVVGIISSQNK